VTRSPLTHYEALGVTPDADDGEIRSAFRELVRQWHPDRNRSPGALEQLHLVLDAWTVVGDPERRRLYDAQVRSERSAGCVSFYRRPSLRSRLALAVGRLLRLRTERVE